MDYSTEELIERYKSEMQKMISNISRPSEQTENITNNTTESPAPQVAPQVSSQTTQEFPRFEVDSQGLKQRIEEILRQNSDVATSDDYPPAQVAQTPPQTAAEAQNLPSDPAFETPPPTITFSLEKALEPQIPAQNIENQIEEQTGLSESEQEVVSRTCIRGGARAQYSPPANTGSSRRPSESETPALSGLARLRVETFAANRAYPVKNAVIRIKNPNDNSLVAVLVTNENGITESVELPAPSAAWSQTPEFSDPFFNYS